MMSPIRFLTDLLGKPISSGHISLEDDAPRGIKDLAGGTPNSFLVEIGIGHGESFMA